MEGIPGFVARMVEQLLARRKDLDSVRKGSAVTYLLMDYIYIFDKFYFSASFPTKDFTKCFQDTKYTTMDQTPTSPPIDCSFTPPFAQQGEEDPATQRLSPTWHILGTGQISVKY